MTIVTFCSFKGGTAKTSTALHLGACLAADHSKKVLLVDFDSQANLSVGLGFGADSTKTMVEVLQEKLSINKVIQPTPIENLSLIPANTFLDGIESTAPLVNDLYAHEKLRQALSELDYDYIFIDTPPSLGWLTQSAFFAANYSLICGIPEPFSIMALNRLKNYHDAIRKNHSIDILGVILTFWDERGATNHAYIQAINNAFPEKLFATKIRRDIAVSRAVLKGLPVFETDSNSRAGQDYKALSEEFIHKVSTIDSAMVEA